MQIKPIITVFSLLTLPTSNSIVKKKTENTYRHSVVAGGERQVYHCAQLLPHRCHTFLQDLGCEVIFGVHGLVKPLVGAEIGNRYRQIYIQ